MPTVMFDLYGKGIQRPLTQGDAGRKRIGQDRERKIADQSRRQGQQRAVNEITRGLAPRGYR